MPEIDYKEVGKILIAGGIGGGMSIIVNQGLTTPILTASWGSIPKSILLGMLAAFLGVYVVANSDRSREAFVRCLGFALLCGLSPTPIIEAGQALLTKQKINAVADQQNQNVKKEVKELPQVSKELAPSKVEDVTSKTVDALKLAKVTGDPEVLAEAQEGASALIEQINKLEEEQKITKEVKEEQIGLLK